MNAPPHEEDLAYIDLVQDLEDLSLKHHTDRFHGKSSGAMLVKAAVKLKQGYEETEMPWSSRRMRYWTFDPVSYDYFPLQTSANQAQTKGRIPHAGPYVFPEPDLLSSLVGLYFSRVNIFYPLLHRPTFDRSVAAGLHLRDTDFAAVVLLVCAIASRFSDDPRACDADEPLNCGWQFFGQLPLKISHLFEPPTLYHLQYYCVSPLI
jgi:hypothetical protein